MCVKYLTAFILTAFVFCSAAINWQQEAKLDLKASYHYLLIDSAGGADKQNPEYSHWLDQGYQKAQQLSRKVDSAATYNLVMNYYINGFHDEHVQYIPYLRKFNFTEYWPKFSIYFQRQHFYVRAFSKHNTPPNGAELMSCDGKSIKTLLLNNVFPYFGNPNLRASWYIVSPRLFFYTPNPWFKKLSTCTYHYHQHTKQLHLKWYPISKQSAFNKRIQTNFSYQGKYKIEAFAKDSIWVSIPSFLPQSKTKIKALQKIVAAAKNWRHKKLIVLDMRGNLGGNSYWGTQLLQSLYGDAYYQQQTYLLQYPVYQWRASAENLKELKGFFSRYAKQNFGINSSAYQDLQKVIQGMQQAIKSQHTYYPNKVSQFNPPKPDTNINNPLQAKILWLTDARCASSCLTFGDQLMQFENVIQIGQSTHADTDYTETVVVILPSGARLYYPMKVQRYRKRANNEPYIPEVANRVANNINNTSALKKWVQDKFL